MNKQFAKKFLKENKLIGRFASPVPEEDITILHHYLRMTMGPYLEIGVLWGGSMVIAGLSMQGSLYGIDPFHGYRTKGSVDPYVKDNPGEGVIPSEEIAVQNLKEYEIYYRSRLFKQKHPPLPPILEKTTFGVVFIDGDHSEDGVMRDWENLHRRVRGLVLLHDLHKSGVENAWDQIVMSPWVQRVVYNGVEEGYGRIGVLEVGNATMGQ